jgi:hypothetical protein
MTNHVVKLPNIRDTIYYKLLPRDLPRNPHKIWHGKAIRISIDRPGIIDHIQVESLESGYEGLTELVMLSQIVGIATQDDAIPKFCVIVIGYPNPGTG